MLSHVRRLAPLPCLMAGIAGASTLDLPLHAAVQRALDANRGLIASAFAREGDALSVTAARSEFDFKLVPTSVLGRANDPESDAAVQNSSIGVQVRKKLDWGTVVSIGPSWNRFGSVSNTTLNVSVHQPLLGGLGREVVLDGVHRAEHAFSASDRSHRRARTAVALETVATYHAAIRELSLAAANEALAERLRRHALVAGSKESAGLGGPSDAFRARIRLKDAEDAAFRAHAAHEQAIGRLRQILSLGAEVELRLRSEPPPASRGTDPERSAIEHSPEFQQLSDDLAEARRGARIAGASTSPDISLNVSYGQAAATDPLLQSFLPTTRRQWSVYLHATGDLNRTAEKINHQRALLRVRSLEVSLEERAADVRRGVRQQLRTIESARSRIALRQEQILQAQAKVALAEVKFAHDMADNFELIEAESDLNRARDELSAAELEHAVGVFTLAAATGEFP